jgi:subtilisin family serine protease
MLSSSPSAPSPASVLPGLSDLWARTTGSPEVCIAVLDGPVDLAHPAFVGAHLEQLTFGSRRPADDAATRHGMHVASVIFGQHAGPVRGVAPRCRGVLIPVFESAGEDAIAPCSQIDLACAIQQATEYGAKIINISGGEYSPSASAHPILADAVRRAAREGVLIVAAAGNDGCQCVHVPGSLPSVLPVGAIDSRGKPYDFRILAKITYRNGLVGRS